MSEFTFNPIFESYTIVLIATLLLIGLTGISVWRRRTSQRKAWVLAGFRIATILVLLVVFLRPSRTTFEILKKKTTIVILVDASRSMLVPDMMRMDRWKYLVKKMSQSQEILADLTEEIEVKIYTFDDKTRAVNIDKEGNVSLPKKPTGTQTAIGDALADILRKEGRKQIIGVVLLTDGVEQSNVKVESPERMAGQLARRGFPLYTIAFGSEKSSAHSLDVDVSNLMAGPSVYVNNELSIRANITARGLANQTLNVKVLIGKNANEMKVVQQKTVFVPAVSQYTHQFKVKHFPKKSGEYKLTVRIDKQQGELVTTNNEQSTYFTVLEGGLRVLYLDGGDLTPEKRHLVAALAKSPDIECEFMSINKYNQDQWPIRVEEKFKQGKFDVYIFRDLDADAFRRKGTRETPYQSLANRKRDFPQLAQLAEAIDAGAGFLMLGGENSFTPGGYGLTPLAELIPVKLQQNIRHRLGGNFLESLHHVGKLQMLPAKPVGTSHYLMDLGGIADFARIKKNEDRWKKLPPLSGANKLSPSRGALVLGNTTDGKPLMISTEYGGGRTLAFAADSTWRWRLRYKDAHTLFWRQVILWLAHQDESDKSNVWVKIPSRRYRQGLRVRFTTGVNLPNGEPAVGAKFKAKVRLPNGKLSPVTLTAQGNQATGIIFDTDMPGDYLVMVEAIKDGKSLGIGKSRFIVDQRDFELTNARANTGLLKSMAEETKNFGGRYEIPEKFSKLLEELKEKPKELEVTVPKTKTFGNRPQEAWLLVLLVAILLGVEWYLRKNWRLE